MKKYWEGFLSRRFLLAELVKKGIRLKYRRSYFGIIWSLIEPVMTTIVLVIVFGTLFNNKRQDYPLYIITGRLIYTFFSNSTRAACLSIRKNAAMIRKVYVPKYFYPLAAGLFNFIIFLISLLVLIPVGIYTKTMPTARIWHILPALAYLIILCVGVGMILATMNTFFRDTEYLWNVVMLIIMYMSAIFYYPERLLASGYAWILRYNPLFCIIDLFRSGMLGYAAPMWDFVYPFVCGVILLAGGTFFFVRKQDLFVLYI